MHFLTHGVRDDRLRKMYALMDRFGLDALILTTAEFFEFATNFNVDVETWERPIFVVIPRNGKYVAVLNELSTNHFKLVSQQNRVWVEDVEFYSERRVGIGECRRLLDDVPEMLAEALKKLGLTKSKIGVDEMPAFLLDVSKKLPSAALLPVFSELCSLRFVKHPEEIEIMRHACSLADWLQDRYRENIRPGRLIQELDLHMASLMVEEAARRFPGANFEVSECFSLSGPSSAAGHGTSARCGARISKGDGLVNIIVPRLNGLAIENERTWFVGNPSADQRRYYEAARAANLAGTNAAVMGQPVSGIDAAAQHVIIQAGFGAFSHHRTGHGMGIRDHEYPGDMSFNDRPLEANEVYSVEPGIYVMGVGGFRLDDTVLVGEQPEVLTSSPRDIQHYIVG